MPLVHNNELWYVMRDLWWGASLGRPRPAVRTQACYQSIKGSVLPQMRNVTDRIAGWPALLEKTQGILDYRFQQPHLALEALTHSSYSNEDRKLNPSLIPLTDNERLEYLGDAVIGLVVAEVLMERFLDACEGKLSRWRSYLVSRCHLAEIGLDLGVGELVLLGQGERRTGGATKRSIVAAAVEALVGAVYFDGGLEPSARLLRRLYQGPINLLSKNPNAPVPSQDNKTYLQEMTQAIFKTTPVYKLIDTWGPEHEKSFRVEIHIDGELVGQGEGRSKKEAEQNAASLALAWMVRQKQPVGEFANSPPRENAVLGGGSPLMEN